MRRDNQRRREPIGCSGRRCGALPGDTGACARAARARPNQGRRRETGGLVVSRGHDEARDCHRPRVGIRDPYGHVARPSGKQCAAERVSSSWAYRNACLLRGPGGSAHSDIDRDSRLRDRNSQPDAERACDPGEDERPGLEFHGVEFLRSRGSEARSLCSRLGTHLIGVSDRGRHEVSRGPCTTRPSAHDAGPGIGQDPCPIDQMCARVPARPCVSVRTRQAHKPSRSGSARSSRPEHPASIRARRPTPHAYRALPNASRRDHGRTITPGPSGLPKRRSG